MGLLPSSNQILWIRPRLEQLKGAVLSFPDVKQARDPATWISVAYAPDQQYWLARYSPDKVREFFGTVTGTAQMSGPDLHLFGNDGAAPSLILPNYKYVTQLAAQHYGNAFRGTRKGNLGATLFEQRTRYVREVEYGILTPQEKLAEMIDYALRDEQFGRKMQAEYSMLANPAVLLAICGVMGIFLGSVGIAAALGGAAFAATFSRLLGFALLVHQLREYEELFSTLNRCLKSNEQSDFYKGAAAIQRILICMLRDISLSLGIGAAGKLGSKAGGLLRDVFVKFAPKRWQQVAEETIAATKAKVHGAGQRWGYFREDLLKRANVETYFRRGEHNVFLRRSKQNGEMIVIREPSSDRMALLDGLRGWADGKWEWIKAKSSTGKWGIVGFKSTSEAVSIIESGPARAYPMGNLKGVSAELDAFIAQHPTCPSWEVPYGKTFVEPEKGMKVFDWGAAGANNSLAKGARCVKVGDRYLIVDALGRPICQDLDIGAISRQGQKNMPGEHLQSSELRQRNDAAGKKGGARNNPEDDFLAEELLNYQLFLETGEMANMIKHGGRGGSMRHVAEGKAAQTPHWSPRSKSGSGYNEEKLLVFLPFKNAGRMDSACFEFAGYAELEAFCKANNFPWTF